MENWKNLVEVMIKLSLNNCLENTTYIFPHCFYSYKSIKRFWGRQNTFGIWAWRREGIGTNQGQSTGTESVGAANLFSNSLFGVKAICSSEMLGKLKHISRPMPSPALSDGLIFCYPCLAAVVDP